MKKNILSLTIITVILTPMIASAAWWNPISWFDSWGTKESDRVEILEERIKELEETIKEEVLVEEEEEVILEEKPVLNVDNKSIVPVKKETAFDPVTEHETVMCYGVAYEDSCPEVNKQFFCGPDTAGCFSKEDIKLMAVCGGTTYDTECEEGIFKCLDTGEAICEIPRVDTVIDTVVNTPSNDALMLDYLNALDKKEEDRKQKEEDRKNSSACIKATEEYEDIREKYEDNREDPAKSVRIALEMSTISAEKMEECSGYVSTPSNVYKTDCFSTGGLTSCTTY